MTSKEVIGILSALCVTIFIGIILVFGLIVPGNISVALAFCKDTGNVASAECVHAEKLGMSAERILSDKDYVSEINAINIMKIITNYEIIFNSTKLFIDSNTSWQDRFVAETIKELVDKGN